MAIKLIDREESVSYKGCIYELTLLWDRESVRKCFCGMPPFFAHIRKDGANFAIIDCYSNDNERFVVKKFMPSLHHTIFGTAGRTADLTVWILST